MYAAISGMNIAQQRHEPGIIELEGMFSDQCGQVPMLCAPSLSPPIGRPKDVVLHTVTVQEIQWWSLPV